MFFYILFLCTPQRGYISNNDLGPYVPWRHLSYVCLSVRPSVCGKHDCVRTQRAKDLKMQICFYYPYAGWY